MTTNMDQFDAIKSILDKDERLIAHATNADQNKLNADHPSYDEDYEYQYYAAQTELYQTILRELFFTTH